MVVRDKGQGALDEIVDDGGYWVGDSFAGGYYPAMAWTAIMQRAMEGLPVEEFPEPAFLDGEAPEEGHEYTPPPPPPSTTQSSPTQSPTKTPTKSPTTSEPTTESPSPTETPTETETETETNPTPTIPTSPSTPPPDDEDGGTGGGGTGGGGGSTDATRRD
jgi:membrane peptidoglycan carboxypeptidase